MRVNPTRLLVQDVIEVTNETKSGIIVPDAVLKKDSMRGKVILTGEGTAEIKMIHNVGDTVIYHPRAGSKFTYEGKELRLIDVSDVLLGGL